MVTIESTIDRRGGITFVRAVILNGRSTSQRVRLGSTVNGPTWAPRRGRAAAEWCDGTWEGIVEAGSCRGVGFATPAESDGDPIALESTERATGETPVRDAAAVAATLEEWAPPRDVLSEAP